MYSRVQETFGHWTSIQRETMSSELLQQRTFSVLYYRSTEQAVTFVREKHSVPSTDANSSREESSKDLARQKMFLFLASSGSWQGSN